MPEKIAGLPAHPLIIHLPIVLGPVVGLLCLLLLSPKLRKKLLVPTAALGVLFAASAIAAVISGENFLAVLNIGEAIKEHADAARTLRLLAIVLAVLLVIFAALRNKLPALAASGLAVVVAAVGVAAIGFTVKTGHEGATLVWKQQFDAAEGAQQQSRSGSDDSGEDEGSSKEGDESAEDMDMSPEEHDAMQGG
ncbi:MAG: hypothetical protein Q7T55_02465 [Solirubrobacteraceae bacterium]|nr:hypothetical protein [Solirubrobacteraceae bacterium]